MEYLFLLIIIIAIVGELSGGSDYNDSYDGKGSYYEISNRRDK